MTVESEVEIISYKIFTFTYSIYCNITVELYIWKNKIISQLNEKVLI